LTRSRRPRDRERRFLGDLLELVGGRLDGDVDQHHGALREHPAEIDDFITNFPDNTNWDNSSTTTTK